MNKELPAVVRVTTARSKECNRRLKIAGVAYFSLVSTCLTCGAPRAIAQTYSVTDLGTLGGSQTWVAGINNAGQLTGYSEVTPGGFWHAFLYSSGSMTDLGTLGLQVSAAMGLNNSGQVVGIALTPATGTQKEFLFSNGSTTDITSRLSSSIPNTLGPVGISDAGQILVESATTSASDSYLYSLTTSNTTDLGAMWGLGSMQAVAISASGQVAGTASTGLTEEGFVFSNSTFTPVPLDLCGHVIGTVWGQGPQGQVLGQDIFDTSSSNPMCNADAFVFTDGEMVDLGLSPPGFTVMPQFMAGSAANVMNSSGVVAGNSALFNWTDASGNGNAISRAFVYINGQMLDLTSLLTGPLATHTILTNVVGINECGQIAAAGFDTNVGVTAQRGYLLIPTTPGSGACLAASLVDPVPAHINGAGIVPDAAALAFDTRTVAGVAADGATQVVLRVSTAMANESVTLTVVDENGQAAAAGSAGALGYLAALLPADGGGSTAQGGSITVRSVSTGYGAFMAYAVYHAPIDFVRSGNSNDPTLASRNVSVNIQGAQSAFTSQSIQIVRPPVILVHGMWGGPGDWGAMGPYLQSQALGISPQLVAYNVDLQVQSSNPTYSWGSSPPNGSSLGFAFGAQTSLPQINSEIGAYEESNALGERIASVQADLVVHSMGGDIARTLPSVSGYLAPANYGQGPVHKVITIGTPHLGSPLAIQLLQPTNSCVANILGLKGAYAFSTVSTTQGTFSGGVQDLKGDVSGTSASLSPALTAFQPGSASFTATLPIGLIAAAMTSQQLATVDNDPNATLIRWMCSASPLAQNLTSTGWPTILGSQSDAIVPLNSQLAGSLSSPFGSAGAVHSPGAEQLGFAGGTPPGPSELDLTSGVPTEVLQLLNTPVTDPAFHVLP